MIQNHQTLVPFCFKPKCKLGLILPSGEFELSKDNLVFSKSLTLEANESKTLYVRLVQQRRIKTGSINITNSRFQKQ